MTAQQMQDALQQLREELLIDKSELSSTKRKLISATDDRMSARAIGGIGGFVLTSVCVVIILADVSRIWRNITHISNSERGVSSAI